MASIVLVLLLVAIVASGVGIYNGLVRKRVDCDNGWAQIDVQLKRRYDLVPNLVETVKGYASHERETLEAVVSARNRALSAPAGPEHAGDKGTIEDALGRSLGRLLALSESYPELKADQGFRQLQEELTSTENKIGFARQHFNDCVARYESSRQAFPANLVAAGLGFTPREYFRIEESAVREVPRVSFS